MRTVEIVIWADSGVVEKRIVVPDAIVENGKWLLRAFDVERRIFVEFPMKDIIGWKETASPDT